MVTTVTPRPIYNNKNSDSNIYGRIIQFEQFLNQNVQNTATPTFGGLFVTGDTTLNGNLYVNGNTSIFDTNITEFQDNILLLNNQETGSGVTLNQSGIEIDRGLLENYRMVYNEPDQTLKAGFVSNMNHVALRQNAPMSNGIMVWNEATKMLDATDTLSSNIVLSITSTDGNSINTLGGISALKSIKTETSILLSTSGSISLDTMGNMLIQAPIILTEAPIGLPLNTRLYFGNTQNSLLASTTGNIVISASNNINFAISSAASISVPTGTSILVGESQINTSSINDFTVTSARDILLSPTEGQKILVPFDIPVAFGSINQQISGNISGDLNVFSNNNISLTPGSNLNVKIPNNAGIKFGNSGNQRVYSDGTDLYINSSSFITTDSVYIPNGKTLSLGGTTQNIYGDGANTMYYTSQLNAFNGSIQASGATLSGDLTSDGRGIFESGLLVGTSGNSSFKYGDGLMNSPVITVSSNDTNGNAKSLISFNTLFDTVGNNSFTIGRNPRTIGVNIPRYSVYNSTGANPRFSITTDSLGTELFSVDENNTVISGNLVASSTSIGNVITNSVTTGTLRVNQESSFNGIINVNNNRIINGISPTDPTDIATKEYVDLVKQGLYVKDPVTVASTQAQDLFTEVIEGYTIDGYTLMEGDRILLKNQLNAVENGIWVISSGGAPPTRALDMQVGNEASGIFVFTTSGIVNISLGWICNSVASSDIVGTDELTFVQFTALGQVVAGDGLNKVFNTLNVNIDNVSIESFSGLLRVKSTIAGNGIAGGSGVPLSTNTDQSHVTKIGTLTQGTWNGGVIGVTYGGTGQTRFTSGNILFGNGINGVKSDSRLYYNSSTGSLGVGIANPTSKLHMNSTGASTLMIQADSDNLSGLACPILKLAFGDNNSATIQMTRDFNQVATGTLPESLVISNDNNELIQFATNQTVKMTVSSNGNVGIGTTNPSARLHVDGGIIINSTNLAVGLSLGSSFYTPGGGTISKNANIGGMLHLYDTRNSTSSTEASLVCDGGASFTKDVRIGGTLIYGGDVSSNGLFQVGNITNSENGSTGSINTLGGLGVTRDLFVDGSINTPIINLDPFAITNSSGNLEISNSSGSLISFDSASLKITASSLYINEATMGSVMINNSLTYPKGFIVNIDNPTTGNLWVYLGNVTEKVQLHSIDSNNYNELVDIADAISKTVYGSSTSGSTFRINNDQKLFINIPSNTNTNIYCQHGEIDLINQSEGYSTVPNGVYSGYTTGSSLIIEASTEWSFGKVNAKDMYLGNAIMHVNSDATSNKPGTMYSRTKSDVLLDIPTFTDIIPSQSTLESNQIRASTSASAINEFYTGWYIQNTASNESFKILQYSGGSRLATIDGEWSTLPVIGDTIQMFAKESVGEFFNNTLGSLVFGYASVNGDIINTQGTCNIICQDISSGNINVNGGIKNTAGVTCGTSIIGTSGMSVGNIATTDIITNTMRTAQISFSTGVNATSTQGTLIIQSEGIRINASSGNTILSNGLTLPTNGYISTDSTSGYLRITGNTTSTESSLIFNNNTAVITGQIIMGNGNININTMGNIVTSNSQSSTSSSSASCVFLGGTSISCTNNATSYTSGGALTIKGGFATESDVYVSGDIHLGGTLYNSNLTSTPSINFSDFVNCSVLDYSNARIIRINNEIIFSVNVEVIPVTEGINTEFQVELPLMGSVMTSRKDIVMNVSGYFDDDLLTVLYNVLGAGVTGTTNGLCKFQSTATGVHIIQIIARYNV